MSTKKHGAKGYATEELLREYFLQAGFFVVRGSKLIFAETELSDIDLWVYERSATLARRRTIIDIKDKQRPQAAERMLFALGLGRLTGVEGVGVATTDKNRSLRALARKNKVLWIDGDDIQRLKRSDKLVQGERLSEEELSTIISELDHSRGGKSFRNLVDSLKSAIVDRFGASSANLSLDAFQLLANEAVKAHPASDSAKAFTRLSFLAASFSAAALDFASADAALRPIQERRSHMAQSIRFGENATGTMEKLSWAEMALREYIESGSSIATLLRDAFERDLKQVPAEDLADLVVRLSNSSALFEIARTLEHAAFSRQVTTFDVLPSSAKGFVGALLDFAKVDRKRFSEASPVGAWSPSSLDDQDEIELIESFDKSEQGTFKL